MEGGKVRAHLCKAAGRRPGFSAELDFDRSLLTSQGTLSDPSVMSDSSDRCKYPCVVNFMKAIHLGHLALHRSLLCTPPRQLNCWGSTMHSPGLDGKETRGWGAGWGDRQDQRIVTSSHSRCNCIPDCPVTAWTHFLIYIHSYPFV